MQYCLLPLLCYLGATSDHMVKSQIQFYNDLGQSIVRPQEYKKKQRCEYLAREQYMLDRTELEKEQMSDEFLKLGCQW